MTPKKLSPYLEAIRHDNSLPIDDNATQLWLKDLDNGFRWILRPVFQAIFAVLLHLVWFFKRLPLPQFSAHQFLQKTICWFCRNFVSPEANLLILRHFWTESNILNFLSENSGFEHRVNLYPTTIDDMLTDTFVDHDNELFDCFIKLGAESKKTDNQAKQEITWNSWRTIETEEFKLDKKRTQILDFENEMSIETL